MLFVTLSVDLVVHFEFMAELFSLHMMQVTSLGFRFVVFQISSLSFAELRVTLLTLRLLAEPKSSGRSLEQQQLYSTLVVVLLVQVS